MAGVVVPVATLIGAVPVTLVTVPVVGAVHNAVAPFELRTFPVVDALCAGNRFANAEPAAVAPVPPLAMATVPVTFTAFPEVLPVPPLAIETVPVTLAALPEMLPLIAAPGIVEDAVTGLVPFPER
jgi:hypothetical protein